MPRFAVVDSAGARYRIEERPSPEPGEGQVLLTVQACGYCHSDENIRSGRGTRFPRVPGHEAAGQIAKLGPGVPDVWKVGDRVGIGWHGGHCQNCDACRDGEFLRCPNRMGCGSSYDGGFAEALVAPHTALARIPNEMSVEDAGPIMCGGITVWNALRNSGASWGDTVAIHGLGGLGHFAVQFADAMGFRTVVISRGKDKVADARNLGADHYIDADEEEPGAALQGLGGAKAIITTSPSGASMNGLMQGLGSQGRLVVVGVSGESISFPAWELLGNEKGLQGSVIGTPRDIEKCLQFAVLKGIKPWLREYDLGEIQQASDDLLAGKMRYRAVITMN